LSILEHLELPTRLTTKFTTKFLEHLIHMIKAEGWVDVGEFVIRALPGGVGI
jgi:hypothetical protein